MNKITRMGVDLAKNVFQVHGVEDSGTCVFKRGISRNKWIQVLMEHVDPGCEIGMGACSGAHHWVRVLRSYGFVVKLMVPQFVKPYEKNNKNDARDAEAMGRPTMRFVSVKSIEQQDIQAMHRVRSTLVQQRTAKANQIRGLVSEYGLVVPQQLHRLRAAIPDWLGNGENGLTQYFRSLLQGLQQDLMTLDQRVHALDSEIKQPANQNEVTQRLQQLRGVGPVVATALLATVGDGKQYKSSRQMAASIGLTPRQHSSGNKERLLGISKRGDAYLRTLLIHGARAVVSQAKHKEDRLSQWVTQLANTKHTNVAAVALANKIIRMAWAMLRNGTDYDPEFATT